MSVDIYKRYFLCIFIAQLERRLVRVSDNASLKKLGIKLSYVTKQLTETDERISSAYVFVARAGRPIGNELSFRFKELYFFESSVSDCRIKPSQMANRTVNCFSMCHLYKGAAIPVEFGKCVTDCSEERQNSIVTEVRGDNS